MFALCFAACSHPPVTDPLECPAVDADVGGSGPVDSGASDSADSSVPDSGDPDSADSGVDTGNALLPDLIIVAADAAATVKVVDETIAPDACPLLDGCVATAGAHRFLKFSATMANIGVGDLDVGSPEEDPEWFAWSECYQHWEYLGGFETFRLRDPTGAVVAVQQKRAFCLMDDDDYLGVGGLPQTNCAHQGLTAGWADTYASGSDCQWIDVSGIEAGDYTLEIEANPAGSFLESDTENDIVSLPVTLP